MNEGDVGAVRLGEELDWGSLETYLRDNLDVSGPMSVQQFLHGSANLTYRVSFGDGHLVVRRPPFGKVAPGAHDMRRESTVLTGLAKGWSRSPICRLFCDDDSVIGAPFLVMDHLEGVVVRGDGIPTAMQHHPDVARRVGLAFARAVGELHCVDVEACGLSSLGRPDEFVERQVAGWWKRWQLISPGGELEEQMASAHRRLAATLPTAARVAIVHGDLKLNNCMFDPSEPDEVMAVLDWDMATLGDPLMDVGTILALWPEQGPLGRASAAMVPELQDLGLPSRDELLATYSESSGVPVDGVDWYVAFAAWKATVIVQQLVGRYLSGDSADERLAHLVDAVPVLASVIDPALERSCL